MMIFYTNAVARLIHVAISKGVLKRHCQLNGGG